MKEKEKPKKSSTKSWTTLPATGQLPRKVSINFPTVITLRTPLP